MVPSSALPAELEVEKGSVALGKDGVVGFE